MKIIALKMPNGKRQTLDIGKEYEVTEEIGKILIDSKRAELKGTKKETKKKAK